MKKNIRDYLPEPQPETVLLQARIRKDLVQDVKAVIRREQISWIELITACLERFLDEMKSRK